MTQPSETMVQAGNLRWCLRIAGRGDPILCPHGIPVTGAIWERVLGPMASFGQVIAPDLPGMVGLGFVATGMAPKKPRQFP